MEVVHCLVGIARQRCEGDAWHLAENCEGLRHTAYWRLGGVIASEDDCMDLSSEQRCGLMGGKIQGRKTRVNVRHCCKN